MSMTEIDWHDAKNEGYDKEIWAWKRTKGMRQRTKGMTKKYGHGR